MGGELIVALNTNNIEEALEWVDRLRGVVNFYKVGLPLYLKYGKKIIEELRSRNLRVFLDLKLHDIPSVVKQSLEVFQRGELEMVTCHVSGGSEMLKEAKEAASQSGIRIAGVTILTSIDRYMMQRFIGHYLTLEEVVNNLLKVAMEVSLDLAVVSGKELKSIPEEVKTKMDFIVPGVRLEGAESLDQKRIITPQEAVALGAKYIVVGRPITHSPNPLASAGAYLEALKV